MTNQLENPKDAHCLPYQSIQLQIMTWITSFSSETVNIIILQVLLLLPQSAVSFTVPLSTSCLSPSSLYSAFPPPFKDIFVINVYMEVTRKATPSSSHFSTSFIKLPSRCKLSNQDTSVGFNSFFCFVIPIKPILMIFTNWRLLTSIPSLCDLALPESKTSV